MSIIKFMLYNMFVFGEIRDEGGEKGWGDGTRRRKGEACRREGRGVWSMIGPCCVASKKRCKRSLNVIATCATASISSQFILREPFIMFMPIRKRILTSLRERDTSPELDAILELDFATSSTPLTISFEKPIQSHQYNNVHFLNRNMMQRRRKMSKMNKLDELDEEERGILFNRIKVDECNVEEEELSQDATGDEEDEDDSFIASEDDDESCDRCKNDGSDGSDSDGSDSDDALKLGESRPTKSVQRKFRLKELIEQEISDSDDDSWHASLPPSPTPHPTRILSHNRKLRLGPKTRPALRRVLSTKVEVISDDDSNDPRDKIAPMRRIIYEDIIED